MIHFANVNKWFGILHVLSNINLRVRQGEVVVVCGPSGSGKSTPDRDFPVHRDCLLHPLLRLHLSLQNP
jgi:ABC-type phosphate transport system ATPase subunit